MEKYSKDKYTIQIKTCNDEILYFSRYIMINKCKMVKMLNDNNKLGLLYVDFTTLQICRFLQYHEHSYESDTHSYANDIKESDKLEDKIIYFIDICSVANYFDYTNNTSILLDEKYKLIDIIIIKIKQFKICNSLNYIIHFNLFKFKNIKDVDEYDKELILYIKNFNYTQIKHEVDWIDIINALKFINNKKLYSKIIKMYMELKQFNVFGQSREQCINRKNELNGWINNPSNIPMKLSDIGIENTKKNIIIIEKYINIIYPELN